MALVTTTEMFKKAYDGGYAIGAFNVNNMEIVQGITEAAGELNSPVILQVSKGARAYANLVLMQTILTWLSWLKQQSSRIPISRSLFTLTTVIALSFARAALTADLLPL